MTPLTRAKIELLKATRENLDSNYKGICNCLREVTVRLWRSTGSHLYLVAGDQLAEYIGEQVTAPFQSQYLENWLSVHRPHLPRTPKRMLSYRLQWLDWMINSLENP